MCSLLNIQYCTHLVKSNTVEVTWYTITSGTHGSMNSSRGHCGETEYEFMLLQLLEGSHKESSSRETDSTTSHFCVCHGDFCICFLQRNTSRSCVKGELQVFYRIILYPYFDSCGFPSLCPLPSFPTSISSIGYISQDSLLVLF